MTADSTPPGRRLAHAVTIFGMVSLGSCWVSGGSCALSCSLNSSGHESWSTLGEIGLFLFFGAGCSGIAAGLLGLFRMIIHRGALEDRIANAMTIVGPLVAIGLLLLWVIVNKIPIMALG